MGLFGAKSNKVGDLTISFYDKNTVSIKYESTKSRDDLILYDRMALFCYYYAKMLYNLGKDASAQELFTFIHGLLQEAMEAGGYDSLQILGSNDKIIEEGPGAIKQYFAELHEKDGVPTSTVTKMSFGEEVYFAPAAVTFFLGDVYKDLDHSYRHFLFLSLAAMHKYYSEVKDYTSLASINAAPSYGLETALEVIDQQNRDNGYV